MVRTPIVLLLFGLVALSGALLSRVSSVGAQTPTHAPSRADVLAAEDARAVTPGQLETLRAGARSAAADLRRVVVRALGRLERPDLVGEIAGSLSDRSSAVRAEAANAVAQAVGGSADAGRGVRPQLIARLESESDGDARAAVCEALGRMPWDTPADVRETERILAAETLAWERLGPAGEGTLVGSLRGLESLIRLRSRVAEPSPATVGRLRRLGVTASATSRRLALLALNEAGDADRATIDAALTDSDFQVRRIAASSPGVTREGLSRALADAHPMVRYQALRAYGRRFQAREGCEAVVEAARDANPHVALLALDLLADPCRTGDRVEEVLVDAVRSLDAGASESGSARLPGTVSNWHRAAHALVALARMSPNRARSMLPRFLAAEPWQVRMYAARAAAQLQDAAALTPLSSDAEANVRAAAIEGLSGTRGHEADGIYLNAFGGTDPQLLLAAANALEGTTRTAQASQALRAALTRLTAADSDNTRDPRLAILDRLQKVGSRGDAGAVEPLLRDPDAAVAERAARVLSSLTGDPHRATPSHRSPEPLPTAAEIDRLRTAAVRVTMQNGKRFELRLLVDLAPVSCSRFARLVQARYYDGLTFHRVVPNFVIQGGSPGANEYSGHTRFWRDEVGRSTQRRGTVGSSTRGRDTGDGQFYVNLVDLPRLDHDYTVFAEVVRGMEAVDAVLEGAVIRRIELMGPGALGLKPVYGAPRDPV